MLRSMSGGRSGKHQARPTPRAHIGHLANAGHLAEPFRCLAEVGSAHRGRAKDDESRPERYKTGRLSTAPDKTRLSEKVMHGSA